MIKGDYDKLQDIAKRHVCAEHFTPVVVAWHSSEKAWVMRCGEGHYPDMVTRENTPTEAWRQGKLPDGPIKDNIERRERRKAMTQEKQFADPKMALLPRADLGSGALLSPEAVQALITYAVKYGLDPYRGHVVMMYGQPYIGLDGYLYKANQSKKAYHLASRPLTDDERKEYMIPEEAHAWLSSVGFPDTGAVFTGVGMVTQEEMTEESKKTPGQLRSPVVASKPWQMAQKRAEWQALRRAFPIGDSEAGKEG